MALASRIVSILLGLAVVGLLLWPINIPLGFGQASIRICCHADHLLGPAFERGSSSVSDTTPGPPGDQGTFVTFV